MKLTPKPKIQLKSKVTKEPAPQKHIEEAATEEMSEFTKAVRDARIQEANRMEQRNDPEYWVAFTFQNRDQKEEFLRKMDLMDLGDKYIDGMQAAEKLGVELKTAIPKMPKFRSGVSKIQLQRNRAIK